MRDLLRRVWYVIRQRQFERELAEEIEFHRAMAQRDLEQSGMGAATADGAARRLLGNTTLAREDSRGVWIWPWLESIWQDAAYAMRNLRRQPGFTAVVIAVLATVIGLHTTLVTVIAGVVLRPWPGVQDAGRVVAVYLLGPEGRGAGFAGGLPLSAYRTVAELREIAERRRRDTCRRGAVGTGDSARSTAGSPRHRKLLRRVGNRCRAGARLQRGRRSTWRRGARRGAGVRLLAESLWRRPGHHRRQRSRQRCAVHGHRRRVPRLLERGARVRKAAVSPHGRGVAAEAT